MGEKETVASETSARAIPRTEVAKREGALSEDADGGVPDPVEASNLNLSKSNINRDTGVGAGGHALDPERADRMKAGLDTAGGALSSGASVEGTKGSNSGDVVIKREAAEPGDAGDAGRISTNLTMEQPPRRDFGG